MKSDGMKTACVTLEDVLVAASIRAASLVPETSGYLTLAIADATSRLPLGIEDRALLLTTEGSVTLARRGPMLAPDTAGAAMRDVLARLLAVSAGTMPGLAGAARPRVDGERDVEGVVSEIEAALVPVNRAAARRALARLARETTRAREMGKIAAAIRKTPASSAPASKREIGNTLVGFAPQPDPVPAVAPSVATMPTLVAEASPRFEPATPSPQHSPRSTAITSVEGARVADRSPNPVAAMLGAPTAAPSMVEPFVEVDDEPFEPTPTALGMAVWTVEEPRVAAPPPTPRPTPLETAPWRALDAETLAKFDLDATSTAIDEIAPVMSSAPPAAATLEPSVPIHVEHLDEPEPSVAIEVEHVEHVAHAEQADVSEPIALVGPMASIVVTEPLVVPVVVAVAPAEVVEASEASLPLVAASGEPAFETGSPFESVLSAEIALGPASESPVLELYVEDLPSLDQVRMTLPWPIFNGEPEPDPMSEAPVAADSLTVPMPAEMIEDALAASLVESAPAPAAEGVAASASESVEESAAAPVEQMAPPVEDIEAKAIEDAARAAIEAHAQGAAMAGADPTAVAPYVFELLRRAARVSAPPPITPPEPAVPVRTRADDLLERFTQERAGDDQSLRAAASSLKALVGLDATPPPLMSFSPRSTSPRATNAADLGSDARPSSAPAFVVPRTKKRRVPLVVPLFCFALGMIAATAAVSALRPEIVNDVAGRIGGEATTAAPGAPKSNAPAAEPRRPASRAERDDKSSGRTRTGN